MNVVCDTMVWYGIGSGALSHDFAGPGAVLWASPVNFLELASHPEEERSSLRIKAASAVLDHAHGILNGPEDHIALLWFGLAPLAGVEGWRVGFKALAQGRSGLSQEIDGSEVTVLAQRAQRWRDVHYEGFWAGVVSAIDSEMPGYEQRRLQGKPASMTQDKLAAFRQRLGEPGFSAAVGLGLATNARLAGYPLSVAQIADAGLSTGEDLFRVYIDTYREYLCALAAGHAPEPNDLGDLEQLLYLQEGYVIATRETRWQSLLSQAGHEAQVLRP